MSKVVSAPEVNARQGVPVKRNRARRSAAPAKPTSPSDSSAMPSRNKPIPPRRRKITSTMPHAFQKREHYQKSLWLPNDGDQPDSSLSSIQNCRQRRQNQAEHGAGGTVVSEQPDYAWFKIAARRYETRFPAQQQEERHEQCRPNVYGRVPEQCRRDGGLSMRVSGGQRADRPDQDCEQQQQSQRMRPQRVRREGPRPSRSA